MVVVCVVVGESLASLGLLLLLLLSLACRLEVSQAGSRIGGVRKLHLLHLSALKMVDDGGAGAGRPVVVLSESSCWLAGGCCCLLFVAVCPDLSRSIFSSPSQASAGSGVELRVCGSPSLFWSLSVGFALTRERRQSALCAHNLRTDYGAASGSFGPLPFGSGSFVALCAPPAQPGSQQSAAAASVRGANQPLGWGLSVAVCNVQCAECSLQSAACARREFRLAGPAAAHKAALCCCCCCCCSSLASSSGAAGGRPVNATSNATANGQSGASWTNGETWRSFRHLAARGAHAHAAGRSAQARWRT